jgi:hypothetical protein
MEYRNEALSTESIREVLFSPCVPNRGHECPSNGSCYKLLGEDAIFSETTIRNFRLHFWQNEQGGVAVRKRTLLRDLISDLSTSPEGATTPHFRINGIDVCKNFFKVKVIYLLLLLSLIVYVCIQKATGFKDRLFEECLSFCISSKPNARASAGTCSRLLEELVQTGGTNVPNVSEEQKLLLVDRDFSPAAMIETSATVKSVESFLDSFFGGYVDCDPRGRRICKMNLDWQELYLEHYLPSCLNVCAPVSYTVFCNIRRTSRPHYQKAQQTRKGKHIDIMCDEW